MKKLLLIAALATGCGTTSTTSPTTTASPSPTPSPIITSNQAISSYTTNMCTQFTGETCVFNGGQMIKFEDGSIYLDGSFSFLYNVTGDTDTNDTTNMTLIPPTASTGKVKLSGTVARGSGYRALFLTYVRTPESLKLVLDTNNNGTPDATDELIAALTLSTF